MLTMTRGDSLLAEAIVETVGILHAIHVDVVTALPEKTAVLLWKLVPILVIPNALLDVKLVCCDVLLLP